MDGTTEKSAPSSPSPSSSVRSGSGSRRGSNMRRSTLRQQQQHSLRKQTSVSSVKSSWRLKYLDFIYQQTNDDLNATNHSKKPDDAFQKLMLKANEYLLSNPSVQVKTCEVITWMSPDPTKLGDSEQMTTSKKLTEGAKTYYVRGLRLWLVPQHIPKVQTLCYEDFVPSAKERITDLVKKINNKIQKKQFKGRILSVQTVGSPVLNGRIQNNLTNWTESVDVDSQYSFLLRVFFVAATDAKKSSSHTQNKTSVTRLIGIKDIVPEATDEGYEGFEVLIEKTNSWIKDQSDIISVANMQSVIVRKNEGSCLTEMGNACSYCMPGINNTESIEFFRILRVAFLRQASPTADSASATIYPFSYETITPQLITAATGSVHVERLETMRETFAKVMAFLCNSGAQVICAETVVNPMQLYCDDFGNPQNPVKEDEIQFLFTIRLYLSGHSTNGCRRSMRRMTSPSQLTSGGTDDASSSNPPWPASDGTAGVGVGKGGGRSSPLFLRSVVNRQFKYRWLVLAVSAFTCMAIIVVVSVVYSNR